MRKRVFNPPRPDVDVGLGELLDQRAVPEFGGDVDRGEAHLKGVEKLQIVAVIISMVYGL